MRHYSTLFDTGYLTKGLALYESLARHSSEPFKLHILALDQECYQTLMALRLPNVDLIPLEFFEWQMDLLEVRNNRTWQEFCWTCASQLCEFLLQDMTPTGFHGFGISDITYLDSDLMFFSDPAPVFDTIGARSIAITPHQFPDNPEKERLIKNGIYNVGLIHFKNTEAGRTCLEQWAAQVRDRCSAEVGCGDQCYLDFFQRDFGDEVCILGHGVNTGPWNLSAYDLTEKDGAVYLGADRLACFHFHEYSHGERLTNYPLRQSDRDLIYAPYVAAINAAQAQIEALQPA